MASCASASLCSALAGEGRGPGSLLCVPRDQAPQLAKHKRQRPSSPRGQCGSLTVKVREGYDTCCVSGV